MITLIRAGIIGSTGYAGEMLTWILHNHPKVDIAFLNAHSNAGVKYSDIYGSFFDIIDHTTVDMDEAEKMLSNIDVLFISLPHGKSFNLVEKALKQGVKVIDLGADYRIKSKDEYEKWYGVKHELTSALEESVYGLVELNRERIAKASLIANPGCYPTASILAIAPLLTNKIIDTNSIIIDAKSGVSGAGRNANVANLFCEVNESVKAYGIGTHRHTPEIEQELSNIADESLNITFTPHLIPMNRGIIATCYSKSKVNIDQKNLLELYKQFYGNNYFVKIVDKAPETRHVRGSNFCHVYSRFDERTGNIITVSVIDNLIKGAAGQAVQCMNLMFGLDETLGLNLAAMMP